MLSTIQFLPIAKYSRSLSTVVGEAWQRRKLSTIVRQTYTVFAKRYPESEDSLFDVWFLSYSAAPLLERYVSGPTPPTAMEMAVAWERQLGCSPADRKGRIARMLPATTAFLTMLEEALSTAKRINVY